MTFRELFRDREVRWGGWDQGSAEIRMICCDSRKAEPDSVFFCLRGQRQDGRQFAGDAYLRGCRCFVTEGELCLPPDATVYRCEDARREMALLAARFFGHPERRLNLVGITGTKGKTTTALMLRSLLARCGVHAAYIGSLGVMLPGERYSTENTTPDSIALYGYLRKIETSGVNTVIIEVSSQAIACRRVLGLSFPLTVFTNLSRDHIGEGEHGSMEEYRRAKLSLFTELSCGKAILNGEDEFGSLIFSERGGKDCVFYGNCKNSVLKVENILQTQQENRFCTEFLLISADGAVKTRIPFAGRHYVMDFIAAHVAACELTGRSPIELAPYAEELSVEGRCEVIRVAGGGTFVIDYAHNGDSLRAALVGLRPYVQGRLFCLFGAVGERSQCRRWDMANVASAYADFSVITEDNPGFEDSESILREILEAFPDRERAMVIKDRERAIRYLLEVSGPGDVVLLAGKGREGYQLCNGVKTPFSEPAILARYGGILAT